MKVFYIVPYLSTGGMPEYLKNKIDKIKDDADIWVFEKRYESAYTTIRRRIENIIGPDRIIVWGDKPVDILLKSIKEIKPDIIHFEEPCEQFLSDYILEEIYRSDRDYKIFETLHDSSVGIDEKIYLPDKFIVVSPWQVNMLQELKIPIEVIEHQILKKPSRDYLGSREKLGFADNKKHVVQIGIFTPRKNQKETIEFARCLSEDIQFHFVGTLAENFKWYWDPLLKKIPNNCIVYGERDDVDLFYQAADLIIFPSIELFNDKETSPLVIKEAISWDSPLLLRNLSVYVDMYQESKNITFMKEEFSDNINIISSILNIERTEKTHDDTIEFIASFNHENNRIDIENKSKKNIGKIIISVKDLDSNACIFSFDVNAMGNGESWWCIPIPKQYFDFSGNKNFSGFNIEFYEEIEMDIPFYQINLSLKKSIIKKKLPINKYLNFDPIFVNYTQFFVDGIYNGFFSGQRIKSVIDIGANVGLFTEWILDRFGSDTFVIGVEPNKSAAKGFREFHKERENVKLLEYAVSNTSGDFIEMLIDPTNSLISSVEGTAETYTQRELVETIDLMSILDENLLTEVDLLKVDVEGSEYKIFENINSNDLRRFKNLLIEFHNNKGRVSDLVNRIKNSGFSIDIRDDDTRYTTDENNDRGTIFATRLIQ